MSMTPCDTEPIHLPGSIQPFGALLALGADDRDITHWSENLAEILGFAGAAPRSLNDALDAASCDRVSEALRARGGDGALGAYTLSTAAGKPIAGRLHRHAGRAVLELEPRASAADDPPRIHELLVSLAQSLEACSSVAEVCAAGARAVKVLTGYDRAMIYRFHEDLHGEVVAEEAAPGLESWLGLHYPASDIPEPARRIFLANKLRVVPVVAYRPVPVLAGDAAEADLDLTRSLLRSVSPIHIRYLLNMRVTASLTVSLRYRGALWGLIACHHYTGPRLPTVALREACEIAGDYVSAAIGIKTEETYAAARRRVAGVERTLAVRMGRSPELDRALAAEAPTPLQLMEGATGIAVRFAGRWAVGGETPGVPDLEQLATWLADKARGGTYVTDRLPLVHAPAQAYAATAAGLIAIGVPEASDALVLWFKPETVRTVTWAGDPAKPPPGQGAKLHPRESFAAWRQAVVNTSLPWQPWEIDAAGGPGGGP